MLSENLEVLQGIEPWNPWIRYSILHGGVEEALGGGSEAAGRASKGVSREMYKGMNYLYLIESQKPHEEWNTVWY